jgi:hypothetical protein
VPPACWSCDDVEKARLEANRQARPLGENGPAPEQLWGTRLAISPQQRADFLRAVALARSVEEEKFLSAAQPPGLRPAAVLLNAPERATVARRAIRRALIDLGYLVARRTMN